LDLLPVRASKGLAIRYLSIKWGLPPERILVAGDSGNDEDMLRGNTLGLVVGNYSPELLRLKGREGVYFAEGHYANGILEGMQFYDFLDHFKQINDTKGHSVGDIVLRAIASVLKSSCRTEDIVARFGGEEFIMLLGNCNLESAIMKAEKLRLSIEDCKPEDLVVTSSIGVAELTLEDDLDSLFDAADKAVYEAKDTGRNKVVAANDR